MLRENAKLPQKGTKWSACYDVYAALDEDIIIRPGQTKYVPLGFATSFDPDFVMLVFARSGLASKEDLAPANKVAVIDSDYRGEWVVPLHNHGITERTVTNGQRIAQLMLIPRFNCDFIEVEELTDTHRGQGGFGSTGT